MCVHINETGQVFGISTLLHFSQHVVASHVNHNTLLISLHTTTTHHHFTHMAVAREDKCMTISAQLSIYNLSRSTSYMRWYNYTLGLNTC